jgi:hypothetical protein
MDRRQYLAAAVGFGAGSLAGCTSYFEDATDGAGTDDLSPNDPSTGGSSETVSPATSNRLSAGSYTVSLAKPRVRVDT